MPSFQCNSQVLRRIYCRFFLPLSLFCLNVSHNLLLPLSISNLFNFIFSHTLLDNFSVTLSITLSLTLSIYLLPLSHKISTLSVSHTHTYISLPPSHSLPDFLSCLFLKKAPFVLLTSTSMQQLLA